MAATFNLESHLEGLNPPIPSIVRRSEGSRLLTVIRLLEQDDQTGDSRLALFTECVEILRRLAASIQRRGMLGGDLEFADQVLKSSTKSSASRKRGRNAGSLSANGRHDASLSLNEDSPAPTAALEPSLVLQGLVRILAWSETSIVDSNDRYLLVALVGDLCAACSEHVQASRSFKPNRCQLAELELLSSFPLVASFQNFVHNAFAFLEPSMCGLYSVGNDELTAAIASSLRAASSLVRLMSTRLSRTSLDVLSTAAWQALAVTSSPDVPLTASILISTLPMQRTTPAECWLRIWREATTTLLTALATLTPIVEVTIPFAPAVSVPPAVKVWIEAIQRHPVESDRIESFLWLLSGLLKVMQCLLGEKQSSLPPTLIVQFEVVSILDLIETVISFGSSAEAVYFGTKKRLRAETVGSGAFGAAALAQMANSVKGLGLELLSSVVEAVGGPSLLPFSERLYSVATVAVRTSCAMSVRSALEPGTTGDARNQRWLQSSIPSRSKAIRSFEHCLIAFGCQQSNTDNRNPRQFDGTLTLVVGTLVETLMNDSIRDASNWGSCFEIVQLIEACANCLEASLVSSGEYLQEPTRRVIDSVIHTCLRAVVEGNANVINASSIRKAFLSMGTAAVATCWSNGASSALSGLLEEAARSSLADRDAGVVASASRALSVCAALSSPRAPAIAVVKGATYNEREAFSTRVLSPDDLLERLEAAKVEAMEILAQSASNAKESLQPRSAEPSHVENPEARITALPSAAKSEVSELNLPTTAQGTRKLPAIQPNETKGVDAPLSVLQSARASLKASGARDAEDDDEFPMIVNADPDEEDLE